MASDDSSTASFQSAAFWRAPIGPPPEVEPVKPSAKSLAMSDEVVSDDHNKPTECAADNKSTLLNNVKQAAAEAEAETAKKSAAEAEAAARAKRVAEFWFPVPAEKMTYEQLTERLLEFQKQWWARYKRKITPEDEAAGLVPPPVQLLYNELGKRLSPEQLAKDQELKQERDAKAAEEAAKAAAEKEAAAAKRAEAEAARAKEWEEFEKNKEAAWTSAAAEAKDQRVDAAGSELGAMALSGAASWVKIDEPPKREGGAMTREEYIQGAMAEFGIVADDAEEKEERRLEREKWKREGGRAADEAAKEEAWRKKLAAEEKEGKVVVAAETAAEAVAVS